MTSYKPFTSECTNTITETAYNMIPQSFGLNNATATQIQKRTISESISTQMNLNPHMQSQVPPTQQYFNLNNRQVIYAQAQLIPGGVSFSFNPNSAAQHIPKNLNTADPQMYPHSQSQRQPCQELLSSQLQASLKLLEQQGLELLLLQEHLRKEPYQLQFHKNERTSTTDLLRGPSQIPQSQGTPDFKSAQGGAAALITSALSENISTEGTCKGKRLLLTKSPDIQEKKAPEQQTNNQEGKCDSKESELKQQAKSKPCQEKKKSHASRRVKFQDNKSKKAKRKKQCSKSRRKCCALHSSQEESQSDESSKDDYDDDEDSY